MSDIDQQEAAKSRTQQKPSVMGDVIKGAQQQNEGYRGGSTHAADVFSVEQAGHGSDLHGMDED
ncbi:hypothetical protein [Geoalkalibacter subterraneus]|jgi:hypothetical protein|nr:hypothetical protein [Geoalkalibacter subterraneus]